MSDITVEQLVEILSGDPEELETHLTVVKKDIKISDSKTILHVHCLSIDAMGHAKLARLAEYMRNTLSDYAIPRKKLKAAKERDEKFKQSSATASLHHQAINLFTDLKKTGEGGEMLLYLLAERFLKIPQVLCKMDLKTDTAMHYHGADGVYASVTADGILKLYWGESKIYEDASDAIRDCLASLSPFLLTPDGEDSERERDLVLLSDKVDLNDESLTAAFRKYFDLTSPKSNRVVYCGVALVGFDCDFYEQTKVASEVAKKAETAIEDWHKQIRNRAISEGIQEFEIQFLCVPLPSAKGFREAFLKALGKEK